jgi:hypothetical protein
MVETTPEQDEETSWEDRELNVRERKTRQAENFMYFGLGLFLAFLAASFASSQEQAWMVTGGFTIVAFVAALGFLRSRS